MYNCKFNRWVNVSKDAFYAVLMIHKNIGIASPPLVSYARRRLIKMEPSHRLKLSWFVPQVLRNLGFSKKVVESVQ